MAETAKDEKYRKIESILRDTPNPTNLFSRKLNPAYISAVTQEFCNLVKEDAAKIKDYETKTTDLTNKLDSALAEKQKLESVNTSCQTKISELEKEIGEVQKKYELFRKVILLQFSDEELESEVYNREEESIEQAEAEDAAAGMEEMGFVRGKETDIGPLGITGINTKP